MPTYDYECDSCNCQVEIFQSINDAPIKECPECGKSTFRRLISAGTGIIFKGSGYYVNDSRKAESKSTKSSSTTKKETPQKETATEKKNTRDPVSKKKDSA